MPGLQLIPWLILIIVAGCVYWLLGRFATNYMAKRSSSGEKIAENKTRQGFRHPVVDYFIYKHAQRNDKSKENNGALSVDGIEPLPVDAQAECKVTDPQTDNPYARAADLPVYRWIKPELIITGLGIILVIISQFIRQESFDAPVWSSLTLLAFGVVFFLLGFQAIEQGDLQPWLKRALYRITAWFAISIDQFILLFFGFFFAILATVSAGQQGMMAQPAVAVTAWILGIISVLVAGWSNRRVDLHLPKQAWLWALGLTLIALPLRVILTTYIPITLSGDESQSGMFALLFLKGRFNNIFNPNDFGYAAFYNWFQSIWISWMGNTTEALRIPSGAVGALTVGAVYLLGRALFGHRVGLLSAIVLAGQHYQINFSRIGLQNVYDGLTYVVTLGALWYGWKREKRFAFLLAGFSLGFAQYFYATARILILLVPVWLIILAISDWKKFKRLIPSLVLMAAVAVVVVLPLAWYYGHHLDDYMAPLTRSSALGEWLHNETIRQGRPAVMIMFDQIMIGLRVYTDTPLRYWYTPGSPMLRAIPAAIFLLGIIIMLLHWKDSRYWLLIVWMFAFGVTGGFSDSTPAAQRYMGVVPATALVVGFCISEISIGFGKIWPHRQKLLFILAIIVAAGLAVDDARFYFFDFTPRSDFGGDNTMIAQILADDMRTRTGDIEVLFFGEGRMGYASILTLPYLAQNVRYADVKYDWGSKENPRPDAQDLIFAILPEHKDALEDVIRAYPGGKLITHPTKDNKVLFWQYEVPASAGRH
jgi:hypothetical protein